MNERGNLLTVATLIAAEMLFTSPNQNIPWGPNTWALTTKEANIDTAHSIKVWTGKEYKEINGIASNTNDEIVVSRNQANWLAANPKTTKMLEENLAEDPWNTTWDEESYTKLIDEENDDLDSNDEEEEVIPACYRVVEDEKWNKTWYIEGDPKSAAKVYYKDNQVNAAVTQMIKQGVKTIDLNYYDMSTELMAFYEAQEIRFNNKGQNQ